MRKTTFQSRNRDAFHVRANTSPKGLTYFDNVSISQSRGFSVQVPNRRAPCEQLKVSISQSRGFSVQVERALMKSERRRAFQSRNREAFQFRNFEGGSASITLGFQSRNREAFQFRFALMQHMSREGFVSISQSRGFSGQVMEER